MRRSIRKDSFARGRKQEVLASRTSSLRAPACKQSTPLQTSESLSFHQNNGRHFLRRWTGRPT